MKIISTNKKALFNYEVIKKHQAGISLQGWEVKSIKSGNVSLKESYIKIRNHEAFVDGMNVSPWKGMQDYKDTMSVNERKLLLNRQELNALESAVKIKGQTIVPIQIYIDKNRIKLEVALARGKKLHDKRAKLKEKDQKRQIERDLKHMGYK